MTNWGELLGFAALLVIMLTLMILPLRQSFRSFLGLIPIAVGLIFFAYWKWGAWPSWQIYSKQQAKHEKIQALLQSIQNPQTVIAQLSARLQREPESARGWYLLGRLYASQNQWQEANQAYSHAYELRRDDNQITVNYAQSLWQLNNQRFDAKVRSLFQTVLKKDAQQPDALAMLAMDAYQSHHYQEAIQYWQRLLAIAPPQSEEESAIRKAIIKAQEKL